MKIVRLKTGSTCVTLPEEQVILVDPALTREGVVQAIRVALPEAHPDAIGHWVEAAMPSAAPLASDRPPRRERRGRQHSHRGGWSFGRYGMQLTSMAAAAALGAAVIPMLQGTGPTPAAAADAWQNPVFNQVEVGSNWDCKGTDSSDLVATCTTPDGTVMNAEAWVGPNSLTFVFTYRDPANGVQHRNTLKVFASQGGVQAWVNNSPTDKDLLANLIVGERWVMYGSDRERLLRWAERLGKDVILPADVSEAAFEMGLLPSPDRRLSNQREMQHVPEVVRRTAAMILVGDESLPIPSATPEDVTPHLPGGTVVPKPAQPVPAPPNPPAEPPKPPATEPPETAEPPASEPAEPAEPAEPVEPVEPVEPPASEPVEPVEPPVIVPVEPPEDPAGDAPAGVPPADGTTPDLPPVTEQPDAPEASLPEDDDDGQECPGPDAPHVPATPPSQPEMPADGELGNPRGDADEDAPVTDQPPADGDEGEPGRGPAQSDPEPADDPLTGPIDVPADAPVPAFEATARPKATPIHEAPVLEKSLESVRDHDRQNGRERRRDREHQKGQERWWGHGDKAGQGHGRGYFPAV